VFSHSVTHVSVVLQCVPFMLECSIRSFPVRSKNPVSGFTSPDQTSNQNVINLGIGMAVAPLCIFRRHCWDIHCIPVITFYPRKPPQSTICQHNRPRCTYRSIHASHINSLALTFSQTDLFFPLLPPQCILFEVCTMVNLFGEPIPCVHTMKQHFFGMVNGKPFVFRLHPRCFTWAAGVRQKTLEQSLMRQQNIKPCVFVSGYPPGTTESEDRHRSARYL